MRRPASILCTMLFLAGCGGSSDRADNQQAPGASPGNTNSSIAGRTLRCQAGGTASNLTFLPDGTLRGQMFDSQASGTWHVTPKNEVHAHIQAGAIVLRDDLRQTGGRWAGRTMSCSG